MVDPSPWPIITAFNALILASGLVMWFHLNYQILLWWGILQTIFTATLWWRDIIRETTFLGHHTLIVIQGLRYGMLLFILSEVCFFFGFFWAFFHSSLNPTLEIGACWPPAGIQAISPFLIPLLNTAVLLSSGVSVTWAHHSIINNNSNEAKQALTLTVFLGTYFSILQAWEYLDSSFSIADSIYGATFFVATGFHGLHVLIGTIFLLISLLRLFNNHFSTNHHFGFEAAAWYWHFVDVIWLFLYVCIYWWGS
uniref:Cytochrome c oxidase subunit 3 n=1 Tax=Ocnus glacialis TaxID=3074281 RepID=A0AA51UD61_9ECHN|nr:cytochrome c oxidase subunit III [Ocnus glacialis]WMW14032.1 cytochrome c oxidase subunit 3 [Ocnus glacialis]